MESGRARTSSSSRGGDAAALRIRIVASSRASVSVLRRSSSREARLRALSAPRRAARRARRNVNRHRTTRRFGFGVAGVFAAANDGGTREVAAAPRVTRVHGYRPTNPRSNPAPAAARARVVFRLSLFSIARVCIKEGNTSCRLAPPIIRAGRMHLVYVLLSKVSGLVVLYDVVLLSRDRRPSRPMHVALLLLSSRPEATSASARRERSHPAVVPVPSANRSPPRSFPACLITRRPRAGPVQRRRGDRRASLPPFRSKIKE